jgi:hypothetical protein
MEAYEVNQKLKKASKGYIVTFGLYLQNRKRIWIHRAQRMMISRRKPIRFHRDFIAKEIFFGTAECFVLKQSFVRVKAFQLV